MGHLGGIASIDYRLDPDPFGLVLLHLDVRPRARQSPTISQGCGNIVVCAATVGVNRFQQLLRFPSDGPLTVRKGKNTPSRFRASVYLISRSLSR